jgi:hypothetical protein
VTHRATARDAPDPHIRSSEGELLAAIANGERVSPALRHLVERIAGSDVVVYVMFDHMPSPSTAGHIAFITAVSGRRYLRISVDRRIGGCQLVAILGHELQHAVEIADEPSVVDEPSLSALYRRIGFTSTGARHTEAFDSQLAIATGQLVEREVRARYTEFTER